MSRQDRINLHSSRALEELDCARNAVCDEAAFAHLALSELHLARVRVLNEGPPGPRLILVESGDVPAPRARLADRHPILLQERS